MVPCTQLNVVMPTDKSGRFAVMSMSMTTYIKAGAKHTENDIEIGLDEMKCNQRNLNGEISMLIGI